MIWNLQNCQTALKIPKWGARHVYDHLFLWYEILNVNSFLDMRLHYHRRSLSFSFLSPIPSRRKHKLTAKQHQKQVETSRVTSSCGAHCVLLSTWDTPAPASAWQKAVCFFRHEASSTTATSMWITVPNGVLVLFDCLVWIALLPHASFFRFVFSRRRRLLSQVSMLFKSIKNSISSSFRIYQVALLDNRSIFLGSSVCLRIHCSAISYWNDMCWLDSSDNTML